jgi:hypothetical protein
MQPLSFSLPQKRIGVCVVVSRLCRLFNSVTKRTQTGSKELTRYAHRDYEGWIQGASGSGNEHRVRSLRLTTVAKITSML